jgi:hypothetical protein
LVIGTVTIGFFFYAPPEGDLDMIDHALFTRTVEEMRSGLGYYESMENAFAEVYGPERSELIETVRAFRPPTTFLLWRFIGSDSLVWLLYLFICALTGVLAASLAKQPLFGILVAVYMLTLGMFLRNGQWIAQFTTSELWALPAMFGASLAVKHRQWWLAAALALCAATVRETAGTLLIVGAALAAAGRLPRAPWFSAATAGVGLYGLHAYLAAPFIDRGAAAVLPTPARIPETFFSMIGFGLPGGALLGSILWLAAMRHVLIRFDNGLLLSAFLWLPLGGLLLDRPYWGVLVVPFALIWGLDEITILLREATTRLRIRRAAGSTA